MDYMTNIIRMDYMQHINKMDNLIYILVSMTLYHFSQGENINEIYGSC